MVPRSLALLALLGVGLAFAGQARASQSGGLEAVDNPDASALGDLVDFMPSPEDLFGVGGAVFGADAMNANRLSSDGLARLADEEGFSARPYSDFKGNSIGYGHLIKPGEDLVYVTEDQARELLLADVGWAEQAVNSAVHMPLSQPQFDALVLFAYNIGAPSFKGSTLVRLLNAGDVDGAAAQFPRWVNAGGKPNPTLIARRSREQALFEGNA